MENVFGVVYMYTNKITQEIYVGQTTRPLNIRAREHRGCVDSALYPIFKEYGEDALVVDVLCECSCINDLNYCEDFIIRHFRKNGFVLYNKTMGGGGNFGEHFDETKRAISIALKGRVLTDEHKRRIGEARRNTKHSEETKQKMSEAKMGKILSDEHKRKLSECRKGDKHPLYGSTLSVETKQKISKSKTGQTHNKETIQKMSESKQGELNPFYGKLHSEEAKQKMSEAKQGKDYWVSGEDHHCYGKHHSEETKQKMSKSMRKSYRIYFEDGSIKEFEHTDQRVVCVELGISTETFISFYKKRKPFKSIVKIEKYNVGKENGFSSISVS